MIKTIDNQKTNAVGKSLCIEFINFCLLKKFDNSRLSLIPDNVIGLIREVMLDIIINEHNITIMRSVSNPNKINIFKNNKEEIFTVDEAVQYLHHLYFQDIDVKVPRISFREMLAPIIRDEKSEFKDIIKCFDTNKSIPADYTPHLFFFHLNVRLYKEIKELLSKLEDKKKYAKECKQKLENLEIEDAKAQLNDLEREVKQITASIDSLKLNDSYSILQDDLINIEINLDQLRQEQKAIKFEMKQIKSIPEPENISKNDISIIFNQFKSGLGDKIEKSLIEAEIFKDRINNFRNTLINTRLQDLTNHLLTINEKIRIEDEKYTQRLSLLKNDGILKDVKTAIAVFKNKDKQFHDLRYLVDCFEDAKQSQESILQQKFEKVTELANDVCDHKDVVDRFSDFILDIHDYIMGNRKSNFEIITKRNAQSKEFIYFDFRIDNDGSYSIDRLKVFMYDVALMLSKYTKQYHPKFLIHDNIFNLDNDSLEKSLNYLHKISLNHYEEFQYIITLNTDQVESLQSKNVLEFDIKNYQKASFTRESRFLQQQYTEIKKNKR